MRRIALSLLALGCVLLVGCQKAEKNEPATTSAPATPQAQTPTPSASTASAEDDSIPTEEDFEDEAEQKISAQNADDELDKLEKEISAN